MITMSTTYLELTLFCPDLGLFETIDVKNDVTSVDLKKAVSARMSTDSINVYLVRLSLLQTYTCTYQVPHGLIKLPNDADTTLVRSALCEHAQSDVKDLTRHNLKLWLDTFNPDEDELHLVVRLCESCHRKTSGS